MALDSRNKRGAAIGFKQPLQPVFPNPDGSLADQTDRQQMMGEYPGILATTPAAGTDWNWIAYHHAPF